MSGFDSSSSLEFDREIDRICDEYERACGESSDPPAIEAFLRGTSGGARARLLSELIALEIDRRRRRGQPVDWERYRARFPDDLDTVDAAAVEYRRTDFSAETESREGRRSNEEVPNLPTPDRIGRYLIERRLGTGGFGSVFLGHDVHLDRRVAIKVPRPSKFRTTAHFSKFLSEARNAARMKHPSIVAVYDVHADERECYIVMEYIEGCDLRTVLKQGALDPGHAARLVLDVAQAMHYAHGRGLIHRDLKPANVLIDAHGRSHVADFGLSIHESIQRHLKGQITGTPSYMSPEQVRGESHRLDARCDIWSLGIILYQLLIGAPPFTGEKREVFHQILVRDLPSLRHLRPEIPVELERIVIRCLSKRVSDRYRTAMELADELAAWLAHPPAETPELEPASSTAVVPKGLRPFEPEDKEFFLQLVAGPRDSHGLPEVIRFWKSRLDRTDPAETFAIGLMCGPSGCGKSSLVRAGVLPRLAMNVDSIYVEATTDDTEVRLIKSLRRKFPSVPVDRSLPEILSGLREAEWNDPRRKIVLVLDQFEQWLHGKGPIVGQQLVEALRQCDGGRLQCVILVRDDFWMPVTRLLRELDVELVQGRNFGSVDLFDTSHARHVLALFGRAYGALPEQLTHPQQRFLDRAIDDLAEDGTIVSVRLALFADLIKDRPWTTATLDRLGGSDGVGVAFLERTFSSQAANRRNRDHQEAVRAVLKSLLPAAGVDIKGNMRSRADLINLAGYQQRPKEFDELLFVLDSEIRLITPTDPEGHPPAEDEAAEGLFYQLTHDYLVPAIRQWINAGQQLTARGRAQLKLEERTKFWNRRPETKQLPTLLEWLGIVSWTRRADRTSSESAMVRAASWLHVRNVSLGVVAALLILITVIIGVQASKHRRRMVQIEAHLDQLAIVETERTMRVIDRLIPLADDARRPLERMFASSAAGSRARLNAGIATAALYGQSSDEIVRHVATAFPNEIDVIARAMVDQPAAKETWWSMALDEQAEKRDRLRAAAALARAEPGGADWSHLAPLVVDWLAFEDPALITQWIFQFRPVASALHTTIDETRVPVDPARRLVILAIQSDYYREDAARLVDLLWDADIEYLPMVVARLRDVPEQLRPLMTECLVCEITGDASDEEYIARSRKIRNVALASLQLGHEDWVWKAIAKGGPDWPGYLLIHEIERRGIHPSMLIKSLGSQSDPNVQFLLALALARFDSSAFTESQQQSLSLTISEQLKANNNPGVHVALNWLAKTNGLHIEATATRNWYETADGIVMVAVPIPDRPVWFATNEITWHNLADAGFAPDSDKDPHAPATHVSVNQAIDFCLRLSERDKIPPSQWCYERIDTDDGPIFKRLPDFLDRTGYRLPTVAEWQFACRAGTTSRRYHGDALELVQTHSWVLENSPGSDQPVGLKPPNPFGLFDMLGNVSEWCHADDFDARYQDWLCGPAWNHRADLIRFGYVSVSQSSLEWIGFRVVRTLPSGERHAD